MSRRAVPRGSQRATKPAQRRARRPDLKSVVPPTNAAQAQWVARQGTRRGAGGGLGDLQGALNYAYTLAYGGRCADAFHVLDEAHRRYPRDTFITRVRANVRRLSGDLSPAVWRESSRGMRGDTCFTQPRWQGEPMPGSNILLWDDYEKGLGLGDAIQMARLVPVVKAQSQATVILGVPAGMKRLFSSLVGVDAIVEPPLPTEGFEAQCRLTLLPSLPSCELTPARLSVVLYLFAEDEAVQRWAPTFADRSIVHVGLHWRGEGSHLLGRQRSLLLSALAPLEHARCTVLQLAVQRRRRAQGLSPGRGSREHR